MRQPHKGPEIWRTIRVPCRKIEAIYGQGNIDESENDFLDALTKVTPDGQQFEWRFVLDITHANHWYHAVKFEIKDIPEARLAKLIDLLTKIGLKPEN